MIICTKRNYSLFTLFTMFKGEISFHLSFLVLELNMNAHKVIECLLHQESFLETSKNIEILYFFIVLKLFILINQLTKHNRAFLILFPILQFHFIFHAKLDVGQGKASAKQFVLLLFLLMEQLHLSIQQFRFPK